MVDIAIHRIIEVSFNLVYIKQRWIPVIYCDYTPSVARLLLLIVSLF